MIRMIVEIDEAQPDQQRNEFGAGVMVKTEPFIQAKEPDCIGATWVGICLAINAYMRSRGARDYDCLKPHKGAAQ